MMLSGLSAPCCLLPRALLNAAVPRKGEMEFIFPSVKRETEALSSEYFCWVMLCILACLDQPVSVPSVDGWQSPNTSGLMPRFGL